MSPQTPEERFSYALHNAWRMWRGALDKRMKDLGVSQAGWLAIAYTAKAEAPPSQSELAALVQVEAATMVATLDRLEKAGLVERVTSESDRRVKRVILTEAGTAIYNKVRHKADAMRGEILGQIAPEKLAAATDVLQQLQTLIENS